MKRSSVLLAKTFRTAPAQSSKSADLILSASRARIPFALSVTSGRLPAHFRANFRARLRGGLRLGCQAALWRFLAISLASLGLLAGCSPGSKGTSNTYQLPWADDVGNYSLQKVEVTSFSHPSDLTGLYGQVLVHPHDDENQKLADTKAAGHFIKAGGVEIAADVLSLQAVTIYAHIERLRQLDTMTGAANSISWPLTYGLDVKTTDGVMSNALYDPKRDAVVIMPYSAGRLPIAINGGILAHEHFHTIFQAIVLKGLPEATLIPTPGVMEASTPDLALSAKNEWSTETLKTSADAAKRMELIQAKLADGSLQTSDDTSSAPGEKTADGQSNQPAKFHMGRSFAEIPVTTYNNFLIHGINEGLADFYGWVYGGDPTFIESSLPADAVAFRRMNIFSRTMPPTAAWNALLRTPGDPSKVAPADFQLGEAYVLGTYYSTFLRELAIRMSNPSSSELDDSVTPPPDGAASESKTSLAPRGHAVVASEVVVKDQSHSNSQLPLSSPKNARALSGVAMSSIAARAVIARALVAALPGLLKALKADYKTAYINPVVLIAPLFAQLSADSGQVNASMCTLAQNFIAQSVTPTSKSALQDADTGVAAPAAILSENLMPDSCAGLLAPATPVAAAASAAGAVSPPASPVSTAPTTERPPAVKSGV